MKTFIVYFKEGKSIVVHATSFSLDHAYQSVTFYKDKDSADPDVFVKYSEVLAIAPQGKVEDEQTSSGFRVY